MVVGEQVCSRCDLPLSEHSREPVRVLNARSGTSPARTLAFVCPSTAGEGLRGYALRVLPLLPRDP